MLALLDTHSLSRSIQRVLRTGAAIVMCFAMACDGQTASVQQASSASTNTSAASTAPMTTTQTATTTPATTSPPQSPPASAGDIGPIAVIFTSKSGKMKFELFHREAPRTCANFLNLIRRGYYLGKQWEDFSPVVRQLGTALDLKDLPYQLPREFSPKHLFNEGGLLCLANTTEDERARGHPCRIFITVKPQERWNLKYVVFGKTTDGLEVAQAMLYGEPVTSIEIEGDADNLLAKYATQVAEWNAILDKTSMP